MNPFRQIERSSRECYVWLHSEGAPYCTQNVCACLVKTQKYSKHSMPNNSRYIQVQRSCKVDLMDDNETEEKRNNSAIIYCFILLLKEIKTGVGGDKDLSY